AYRTALVSYLTEHSQSLSPDSQRRITSNPLRVLDSKEERDKVIVAAAPLLSSFFDDESLKHFSAVCHLLDVAGIPYVLNPLLVRGLDYYNQTVFEFTTTELGSQNAIGGGGRYDPLFAMLGGGDVPAVGFSIGIERVMLLLEAENGGWSEQNESGVYLCAVGDDARLPVQIIAYRLRSKGLRVVTDLQRRSMKAQLKDANRERVLWTVMIGDDELVAGTAVVKNMLTGEQQTLAQHDLESVLVDSPAK
ncbi:MAG: ATP phosphoribosyltransferase regulatory subunit, partial [Candidatus Kapabacteria bacterium]|nr:ATP phosphoribosyltransferase regulatory subunit [Candidatus Kapabacteria bacterium]